jgi:hypothetical protein
MNDPSGSAFRVHRGLHALVDWTGPRRDAFPMLLPPRVDRHNLNGLIRLGSQCCLAVNGCQYFNMYMILDLGPIDISKATEEEYMSGLISSTRSQVPIDGGRCKCLSLWADAGHLHITGNSCRGTVNVNGSSIGFVREAVLTSGNSLSSFILRN